MKQYFGHTLYRGRCLDVTFCAKSQKEAAEIMNCSVYYIQNYFPRKPIDNPFTGVKVTKYGSSSCNALEPLKEYDLNEAKKLIDEHVQSNTTIS